MHQPIYVSPSYQHDSLPAVAAGKTGVPEVLKMGGIKATNGKIVFTGNLIAGDTITVGGKVFTAKASGATGQFEFNVDTTLALSLTALATVLNACTDAAVSVSTYSVTDTNTAITSTLDSYGVGPTLASTHDSVVVTAHASGVVAHYFSLDTEHSQAAWDTVTADVYLPDGDETQRKTIAYSGTGTLNVVSPTDKLPGSTNNYALTNGDVLVLQFLGGKWRLILNDGAVAS